jgi:serine/threonine-protein kinase HipA
VTSTLINRTAVAGVTLEPRPGESLRVGSLIRDASGGISFIVDDSFIALGSARPLVSLAWSGRTEQDSLARLLNRNDKVMRSGLLPVFFANLLPEGALRELVEQELGTGAFDDLDVLVHLGQDLPGALVVTLEAGTAGSRPSSSAKTKPSSEKKRPPRGALKFSLAGVQLKFSMRTEGRRLTVPGRDQHGDIIIKVPSAQYPLLPEAEFTGLELAKAAGVQVAEAWLASTEEVAGIPAALLGHGDRVLAVRRFDRGADGLRIQSEDFAQILGALGNRRYTMANDETVLNIVRRFSGDWAGNLLEAVRRMVVNIMLGNGDAHLKNWSFLYPSGERPRLTPAYDLVPTCLYGDATMALAFGGTRTPERMGLKKFQRAARLAKVDEDLLVKEARRTVENILDVWPEILETSPLPEDMRRRLMERWDRLQLVKDTRQGA